MKELNGRRLVKIWREWIKPILVVLIVLSTFRSAVADWNDVPTGSMKPTVLEGDRIFVNKLAYDLKFPFTTWRVAHWADPQPGDIVILFSPADGTRLVKRVVGTPGDEIAMVNNRLIINGRPLKYAMLSAEGVEGAEPIGGWRPVLAGETLGQTTHMVMVYPGMSSKHTVGVFVVPPGKYFVMGDNRDGSRDSRYFGFVDRSEIVGKVPAVVLSVDPSRYYLPRLGRFFKGLD